MTQVGDFQSRAPFFSRLFFLTFLLILLSGVFFYLNKNKLSIFLFQSDIANLFKSWLIIHLVTFPSVD